MDSHKEFWEAFADEMDKEAGFGQVMNWAGRMAGQGIAAARPLVQSGIQKLVASPVGQFIGKRPMLGKALGFAGTQLAVGAAGTAAEIPFRSRKQIIRVVPGADQGQDQGFQGTQFQQQYNRMGGY